MFLLHIVFLFILLSIGIHSLYNSSENIDELRDDDVDDVVRMCFKLSIRRR